MGVCCLLKIYIIVNKKAAICAEAVEKGGLSLTLKLHKKDGKKG